MKKRIRWINALVVVILLVISVECAAYADDKVINSQGRIVFDNDTEDTSDDVIFDASDLTTLDTMVKEGKAELAGVLNEYPNTAVQTLDTFDNLAGAIDSLTDIPEIYYYDKATEGDNCARYILVDGSYYPCDQYGVQTSDNALAGTITVVAKDDTSVPAEGEIQLVKYEKTDAANLSAGYAGYADKSFVLGSGSDNISYRNQGASLYLLGTGVKGTSFDISTIVGTANVGNYTADNFIAVISENKSKSVTDTGVNDEKINHASTATATVKAPTISYDNTTGVATLANGTVTAAVTQKYSNGNSGSSNCTVTVYFFTGNIQSTN